MTTLAERLKANTKSTEQAVNGVDTSRPLIPEGEYMAEFVSIGGYQKDSPLNWGISKEGTKNAGKPWANFQVSWKLDSKSAVETLKQEKIFMRSENPTFLTLQEPDKGIGIDIWGSSNLVNFLGVCLLDNGATKNGALWVFDDFVFDGLRAMDETIAETFEFNPELKDAKGIVAPEDIQVAMAQMVQINKLLEDWRVKANVFIVQVDVMKDGKSTGDKRNVVRGVNPWVQLED